MFIEFPELLASIYIAEKMLPHEAIEIQGARRYVEHNMVTRHKPWSEQFCRPSEIGTPISAVALDAIRFGPRSVHKQYWVDYIKHDLRKCSTAVLPVHLDIRRKFVTGLWGCGAFRGDPELKFLIQWISCSMEPSIVSMVFCPFDQKQKLIDAGLLKVLDLLGEVSVKQIIDILGDDGYATSDDTFGFLIQKLQGEQPP